MRLINRILLLIVALQVSVLVSAQRPDPAPVQVIWKNGNDNVTISEAKDDGVVLSPMSTNAAALPGQASAKTASQISIECLFKAKDMADVYPDGADYEVKWYYYMSTRKMLMSTKVVSLKPEDINQDGFASLVCYCKQNPRAGWWEVQIKNKQSSELVTYADQDTYQILLKN
ncbi:MAG: hypothetical protein MJZ66_02365 [Bacteroidales bacterium]|nr:hypothetical protein [Bacteroidales bacterium]